MSAPWILYRLYSLDPSSPDFLHRLYPLIRHDEKEQFSTSLQGLQLIRLVDLLDEVRTVPSAFINLRNGPHRPSVPLPSTKIFLENVYTNYKLSAATMRPYHPHASYLAESPEWVVARLPLVELLTYGKVFFAARESIFIASTQEHLWALQSFFREAVIWKRLRHPNIVPFIGDTTSHLQVVSKWMQNGTLIKFIKRNPGTDRISLVSPFMSSCLTGNVIFPSYWISPKVSTIFMRTVLYTET